MVLTTARTATSLGVAALLLSALQTVGTGSAMTTTATKNPVTKELLVYVGTYTAGKSKGIYAYRLDLTTGKLTPAGVTEGISNPSFLAIHPNGRNLYAVNEVGDFNGQKAGAVTAFKIEPKTGGLTMLNQESSKGGGPCHLVVDRLGKVVLAANYGGGSVVVLPIGPGGRLKPASDFIQHQGSSVNKQRQEGPHAHSINVDAANRFVVAADLGLDKVLIYQLDTDRGRLEPNSPPFTAVEPGAGPRHFAFHPGGKHAYVINELGNTVTAFDYDRRLGMLTTIQSASTLPAGFSGTSYTAEVQVSPSGKFLYGSNRGHDSIAVFRIDETTGRLTLVEVTPTQGKTPRNFGIDPTGQYLLAANQESDNIVVFRIDPETGKLTPTGNTVEVPKPICVKFLPLGG
jgi:6-phosphogluconolactonase